MQSRACSFCAVCCDPVVKHRAKLKGPYWIMSASESIIYLDFNISSGSRGRCGWGVSLGSRGMCFKRVQITLPWWNWEHLPYPR